MAVILHHIKLKKAQLDAMPKSERNFLILLAHCANELAILAKLFHFSAGGRPRKQLNRQLMNVQALLMGRLVTGKIHECWVILKNQYFGKALQKKYHRKLDAEARAVLETMQKYFTDPNLIRQVRNKFAFHYDVGQIAKGYATLKADEPLDIYLSKSQANTLYAFADVIAGHSMLETIKRGDTAKAMGQLISETSRAIGWINIGTGGLMAVCFQEHIGGTLYELNPKTIKVMGVPSSQIVRIPYFIEVRDEPKQKPRKKK